MVRENDAAKVGRHGGEVGDFCQGVGVINVTDAFCLIMQNWEPQRKTLCLQKEKA